MANQLVLVGNRVVAHGQDCFSTIPGAVVCLTNGKIYVGATIAECSTECPADIDAVGYEYHAGVFVPCAPFFQGDGNVAVWCDSCKAPKDSGFPSQFLGKVFHTTYTGTGVISAGVTCGFKPKFAIVQGSHYVTEGTSRVMRTYFSIMSERGGTEFGGTISNIGITTTISDDGISWVGASAEIAMNETSGLYTVIVFG